MLKGAIHIHSTYSDGEFTLEELREVLVGEGCTFLCVADHAEYFNTHKLREYVAHCTALSDQRFLIVPGLEYRSHEGMHILGYGMTTQVATTDLQKIIEGIEKEGGVPVIAHPKESMFGTIESLRSLPKGIEIWNSKYDGQYAPRPATIALLQRLKQRKPDIQAFYGQDLHWRHQHRGVFTLAQCETLRRDSILQVLANGHYCGSKDDRILPSSGDFSQEMVQRFDVVHRRSARLQKLLKTGKRLSDRLGIKVPSGLKAQIRRVV